MYSWAYLSLPSDETDDQWILMRRNDSTGELAFYRCYSPQPVPLGESPVESRRHTLVQARVMGPAVGGSKD